MSNSRVLSEINDDGDLIDFTNVNVSNILVNLDQIAPVSSPDEEIIKNRGKRQAIKRNEPQSPRTLATRKSPRKQCFIDTSAYFLLSPVNKRSQTNMRASTSAISPASSSSAGSNFSSPANINTSSFLTPIRTTRKRLYASSDSGNDSSSPSPNSSGKNCKRSKGMKSIDQAKAIDSLSIKLEKKEIEKKLNSFDQNQLVKIITELISNDGDLFKKIANVISQLDK